MSNTKELFEKVAKENSGIKKSDVKKVFFWYDMLGFSLAFQLLFIASYILEWKYVVTTFSCVFIILVDSIVKEVLDNKPKNYIKLKDELPLVKLWAIPLTFIAIVSTLYLILTTFFV